MRRYYPDVFAISVDTTIVVQKCCGTTSELKNPPSLHMTEVAA